jgi:HlyD family secretion protein
LRSTPEVTALPAILEMLKTHRWSATGIALAIVVVGGLALRPGGGADAVGYRTEPVKRGDLAVVVSATGNVQPTNQVDVGSELSGTVDTVLVDDNDRVRKGQVLAKLDVAKLTNAVTRARAALQSAEAGVRVAEATTGESRYDLDRLTKARALTSAAASESDVESAKATLARSIANEAAAHAAVAQARATLESAETDLAKGSIRSPIDGVVLNRNIEPGQTVAASLQAPVLFTLAEDLKRMELEVDIDEADVGRVATGQRASFTVDAWPERQYPAHLTRVSFGSRTTDGVVTYRAILAVDNDDLSLRPGMTATATITAFERKGVLLVPNAALRFAPAAAAPKQSFASRFIPRPPMQQRRQSAPFTKGAEQRVHVLKDGVPVAVPITVGESDGRVTEVLKGELAEGAAVVIEAGTGR